MDQTRTFIDYEAVVNLLFGGERQRIASARTLLIQPKVLCMDAPVLAL